MTSKEGGQSKGEQAVPSPAKKGGEGQVVESSKGNFVINIGQFFVVKWAGVHSRDHMAKVRHTIKKIIPYN